MTSVWRRIQQSGKKSAKYRFTITPQELLIVCSTKWQPQNVVLACMHRKACRTKTSQNFPSLEFCKLQRRRKVEGRVRKWEGSMTDPCRALIVWPTQTPDPLHFDTTLYCDNDSPHHYTDKEWTLLVEECTRKGKRRAIAAVNLNMPLFVQNPGTIAELKIKLRPLWPELSQCSMQILISSMLISEEETNDFDARSEASSVNGGQKATSIAGDVAEPEQRANSVGIDNTIVTSYSVNLNEVDGRKMSDEENWAEEALKIDDPVRSNGIVDMREKFVDHLCNKSAEKDTKAAIGAEQRKPVPVMEVKEIIAENSETHDEPPTTVNSVISQQTPKLGDAAKADAIDAVFQMKALNETPKVSLEEKAKTLPAVDEEEDLLSWCQRVTKDYHSVKITDFTKSFRSGLAFCAIIHRYRPDLIGPFSKLDFADSHSNRHENCRKAFDAAILVGVEKKLDPGMTVTLPDRNEIRSFLSELRMRLVDIPAIKREMSVKESDHRISALFDLSESETSVMKELESLRREREREEAIDLTNVPDEDRTKFSAVVRGSGKAENIKGAQRRARKLANPFDSDSDEADASKCTAHISVAPPSSSTVVVTDAIDDVVAISPMVTARHEELMKKRQQIAAVPSLNDASLGTVERDRRHREEARRLMNDAALDGATLLLGGSAPTTAHHSPAVAATSGLLRKLSEATSEEAGRSNLRTLEVVIPTVNIYSFKKIQPSPIFQRKIYEAPLIAAFERPTQRLSNSSADVRKNSLGVTLDRAKRYGSMRGQELAETVAKVAGRAFTPSLVPSEVSVSATPTRKLISQWEADYDKIIRQEVFLTQFDSFPKFLEHLSSIKKDGADLTKIQAELNRLSKCLLQVSAEDETICAQLMKTEVSSEKEERLLQEHMRLLTEKDAIVRRTEYFNVLEQLREVEDEITKLQHELGSASSIGQDDKTEEDKQRIDKMMDDLVALVNKKDRLSQKLISHEAEDEEMGERDRLTLEAAANFSRGSEQPLSASKRLITWIRSEISS